MAKAKRRGQPRCAQLVADAVAVLCPYCGEPQPNPKDGSEQWEKGDFPTAIEQSHERKCVACDEPMLVFSRREAQFT